MNSTARFFILNAKWFYLKLSKFIGTRKTRRQKILLLRFYLLAPTSSFEFYCKTTFYEQWDLRSLLFSYSMLDVLLV
jgi:hypothetical protein